RVTATTCSTHTPRMPAASTGCGRCGSGWTVRRWAATKATWHGSIGTTSTPRPRVDRRDRRTCRRDTGRGVVDAAHHLRGCRARWHARHVRFVAELDRPAKWSSSPSKHKGEVTNEDTLDRVTGAVGGCAPATARERERVDPRA